MVSVPVKVLTLKDAGQKDRKRSIDLLNSTSKRSNGKIWNPSDAHKSPSSYHKLVSTLNVTRESFHNQNDKEQSPTNFNRNDAIKEI